MAGRTPPEAVHNFLDPLRRAISCVTTSVLDVAGGYHPSDWPHLLTLAKGDPVRLAGERPVWLSVTQHYRVVEYEGPRGPWKVSTAAYWYYLSDADQGEIIAYHWHPAGRSAVTSPHLHLGPAAEVGHPQLADAHIPTGRVALEAVLRLAIRDMGARPLREDWEDILDESQAAHETWRTWGSGPAPLSNLPGDFP